MFVKDLKWICNSQLCPMLKYQFLHQAAIKIDIPTILVFLSSKNRNYTNNNTSEIYNFTKQFILSKSEHQ